ncbi:MAG: metallophosphoesterase family protein, partial [Candidatus Hydrogenedentes bacterium]|nr:metallophosphoesterase family protein [Candidatus Hydrogenedentota bacterium]
GRTAIARSATRYSITDFSGDLEVKIAVISDIHANFEALDRVLLEIAERNVDTIMCLGDIVGYNADPNPCVHTVKESGIPSLLGNHDAVACGLEEPWGFNAVALTAALWTRNQLTEENTVFIRELPDKQLLDSAFLAVHGAPSDRDMYLFSMEDIRPEFDYLRQHGVSLCFFGHTHCQGIFSENGPCGPGEDGHFRLEESELFFVNPGSVGQPRDGDARAAFAIYDAEVRDVELIRVEYDKKTTADKISQAGLPLFLAERLMMGR